MLLEKYVNAAQKIVTQAVPERNGPLRNQKIPPLFPEDHDPLGAQ